MNATLAYEWISRLAGWAAEASLAVLLPAIVVLCVSQLRMIPARWCALLAALLLVRLLLPEVVPVSWRAVRAAQLDVSYETHAPNLFDESTAAAPSARFSAMTALPVVWALGTAGVLAWLAFSFIQVRRLAGAASPADRHLESVLRDCARAEGIQRVPQMVVVPGLPSVAILGWLRPQLLVPEGVEERHTAGELRGIFLHELQHIKRGDSVWTWLGLIACAMHWFNPLAWMLFRRFCADRELACDEAVLDRMKNDGRRSYGEALIKTAERYATPALTLLPSFSSSPTELKHRMKLIMKPQSKSLVLQLVSAIVGIGIATFTFTTARADGEKKKGEGDQEEVKKPSREGDGKRKEGARDGESKRTGPRDGEGEKKGPRDGEMKKTGARDGEAKKGARDGEGGSEKKGARDGDQGTRKTGARDGDGEGAKKGARDGEGRKSAEGEGRKSAEGEGGEKMREGERGGKTREKTTAATSSSQQMIIQVNAEGNVVNSKGDVIDIKMVRGRMKQIADENPDQSVILRADANTAYAKVLNVLDALKDAGLKDVKLESGK